MIYTLPRRLREGLWGPIAPPLPRKPLCRSCWEGGPAPRRCLLCADAQTWRPRNRDISPQAPDCSCSPAQLRVISPLAPGRDRQLRSQSSRGSCSTQLKLLCSLPFPGHSAWFDAYNLLLGRPLRLAGLGSPGVPSNSAQAFLLLSPWQGIGLLHFSCFLAQTHACPGGVLSGQPLSPSGLG